MFVPREGQTSSAETPLDQVLALVEARRGLPLALYRRPMVERRLGYRMRRAGAPDLAAYLVRLSRDERELDALIDTVCIKVSRFFRDGPVFERLEGLVRDAVAAGRPLRIWSAGCARGEEPYSLAALLDAAGAPPGCRVLATDADPGALAAARAAAYPAERLDELPEAHRGRFVLGSDGAFRPDGRLRDRVDFALHDLGAGEGPGDHGFDLVLCRNVLIYFTRPLQRRAADRLARSLAPGGVLCLGEAEWFTRPAEHGLEPLDRRLHLLRRPSRGSP